MPDAQIDMESWVCPAPLRDAPNIVMGHGGGGAMSGELIEHLFLCLLYTSPSPRDS